MWLIVVCLFVLAWMVFRKDTTQAETPQFSELYKKVLEGKVEKAVIVLETGEVTGEYQGGRPFKSNIDPTFQKFKEDLYAHVKDVKLERDTSNLLNGFLTGLLPIALVIGFWFFMIRQMQSGGNKALSFGKSRARLHSSQQKKVTFKDVAGVDEAKEELQEII